jgi:REP element-mobilizing transposase RayT
MFRSWLLTSTFYGNWLPGDPRGFVSSVRDVRSDEREDPIRHEHDKPGTEYDRGFVGLHRAATEQLQQEPIRITLEQADVLLKQFQETAQFRVWSLLAAAIMSNHIHIVVTVPGDPDPEKILGDFKAYGSRALNRTWGKPASSAWWTFRGSKRKLPDERAVRAAVEYVRQQKGALALWIADEF